MKDKIEVYVRNPSVFVTGRYIHKLDITDIKSIIRHTIKKHPIGTILGIYISYDKLKEGVCIKVTEPIPGDLYRFKEFPHWDEFAVHIAGKAQTIYIKEEDIFAIGEEINEGNMICKASGCNPMSGCVILNKEES